MTRRYPQSLPLRSRASSHISDDVGMNEHAVYLALIAMA